MKDFKDCIDIADAHAQYTIEGRMTSASMIKKYLLATGTYGYFKDHTNDLQVATYDEILAMGEFNFIEGHPNNILDLMNAMIEYSSEAEIDTTVTLLDGRIISITEALTALKQYCVEYSNKKVYPYADKTQGDLETAKYVPVEQEVAYPSESYIIKAGTSQFEFDFIVNDGSTDNVFDVRLEVCEVEGGQHEDSNWFEVKNAFQPVKQGTSLQFKEILNHKLSKSIKMYTRWYFTSRNACDYEVSVKGV